jgi:hypothetical protein
MKAKIKLLLVLMVGVVCSLAATMAFADGWSGRTIIDKITVRADRAVIVFNASGNWKNPDGCDNNNKIILLPPGAEDANPAYKEVYASLLAAHLINREINAGLKGCASIGNLTYPVLSKLTIY